jgi:hypothetical protein
METPRHRGRLGFGACALVSASLAVALILACGALTLDSPVTRVEIVRLTHTSEVLAVSALLIQIGAAWTLHAGLAGPKSSLSKILRLPALVVGSILSSWLGGFLIFAIAERAWYWVAWHIIR